MYWPFCCTHIQKTRQTVAWQKTKRLPDMCVVAVRTAGPETAVAQDVQRVQQIHCASRHGHDLFNLRHFVAGNDVYAQSNHDGCCMRLGAEAFSVGIGVTRQCGLCKHLPKCITRSSANDDKTPGPQLAVIWRAQCRVKREIQHAIGRGRFGQRPGGSA